MIIEVGQVWKKPTDQRVIVSIDKIEDNTSVHVTVNDITSTIMSAYSLKQALNKNGYILLSDLTKALL